MAPPTRPAADEQNLQGFRLFRPLAGLLDHLRAQPAYADKSGNRRLRRAVSFFPKSFGIRGRAPAQA
jgi:hypothetical protein